MTDPIQHIVVLMMENRSFDQMLGALQALYPQLEGVPGKDGPRINYAPGTPPQPVQQAPNTERVINPGPMHEFENVTRQLYGNCGGFVGDYASAFPNSGSTEWDAVMGYYPLDSLPVLHTLAKNFLICDHWFSSLPGPTWPNRFFVHSGTSLGRVHMPNGPFDLNLHWYDQPTVYQRLEEKGISWKIYHHGMPQSTLLTCQWEYLDHYAEMDQFLADARQGPDAFPQYCFIEPDYSGTDENDQHPPSDVMGGEALIAQVYNTLRANEALWQSTLLVLIYDEHGGFYDHIYPPAAVAPDAHHEEYSFNQLGLRVPALLISPWVERGVCSTVFDHTSLLRYVSDKWQLGPLGQRVAQANSFATELLHLPAPRTDTPTVLKPPAMPPAPVSAAALAQNAEPLLSFAQILGQQTGGRASQLANQPNNPIELNLDNARQFFQDFLNGQSAPPKKN